MNGGLSIVTKMCASLFHDEPGRLNSPLILIHMALPIGSFLNPVQIATLTHFQQDASGDHARVQSFVKVASLQPRLCRI